MLAIFAGNDILDTDAPWANKSREGKVAGTMSAAYKDRTTEELKQEYASVKSEYEALKAKELKLNMARGKPGKEQLDMVSDILTVLSKPEDCIVDGVDARNYGELTGLPSAKALWADILGCKPEECFIGGNASLTLM